MRSLLLASAFVLVNAWSSPATAQKYSAPASAIVQIDRARIDRALTSMIAAGRAVGVSALIFKDGREVYFGTAGHANREASRPMRRETLVQIFSMTKPVTGVALMQLWEQGRFALDDPLAMHLPEYAQTQVFKGMGAHGKPILAAPSRPILMRDVLRHTAGFSYGAGSSFPEQEFERADPLNLSNDLAEFSRRLATVPLAFEPGTQWRYSAAVDVQARLVEKLSGLRFEDYVRRHVLDPLGMKDTGWTRPQAAIGRLAFPYIKGPDGKLSRQTEQEFRRMNFSGSKLTMGGAGLISSIDDYMRFVRMLLDGGSFNNVRILKPSTVKLISTDQLDPHISEREWLPGKGSGGFGINVFVRTAQPQTSEENRGAVREFFWDGRWSTFFWADPVNRLAAVFFVQVEPFDGTLQRDFRRAVYGEGYVGPGGD